MRTKTVMFNTQATIAILAFQEAFAHVAGRRPGWNEALHRVIMLGAGFGAAGTFRMTKDDADVEALRMDPAFALFKERYISTLSANPLLLK